MPWIAALPTLPVAHWITRYVTLVLPAAGRDLEDRR
jgi:hypothetical protein